MRYYDLDNDGRIKGSCTSSQPDKNLLLLDDPPSGDCMWDGKQWVLDTKVTREKEREDKIRSEMEKIKIEMEPELRSQAILNLIERGEL